MSLRERLAARIRREGALSIADYMAACLHDPTEGYYATRPRLGESGDFITAPHVSQMFGELIGLWSVEVWVRMGRPGRVRLVEIGPGDGTLMADILRAMKAAPDFQRACEIWLVETSAPLRAAQGARLSAPRVAWAGRLQDIPQDAPAILIANELLDCLPIRQAVATPDGWRERVVGLDSEGALTFDLGDPPARALGPGEAGEIREWSDALEDMGREVAAFLVTTGGAGLFIDYGRAGEGSGDTLQALRSHTKVGPLETPGAADLTAHVDFPAFLKAARNAGALTSAIATQGEFLGSLGIGLRARSLKAANPARDSLIDRQVERLIAPDQMGALFKVAAISSVGLSTPGFAASPFGLEGDLG
jgi:SAM-dependent MidA family methyltransferase